MESLNNGQVGALTLVHYSEVVLYSSWHIRMRNAAFQAAKKFAKPAQFLKYRKLCIAKAFQMIHKIEWDGLLHEDDVDRSAINWYNKFIQVTSTCIPQHG